MKTIEMLQFNQTRMCRTKTMPVADEHSNMSIKGTTIEDLHLHGDKIKLESRPSSTETATASGRCAHLLQGTLRSARPVSANPVLTSDSQDSDDDYAYMQKLRRPVSADNLIDTESRDEHVFIKGRIFSISDNLANQFSRPDTLEAKDSVHSLPSSELFQSLIEEEVPFLPKHSEIIASSKSSNCAEDALKPYSDIATEALPTTPEQPIGINCGELTPGLKAKPPLPPPSPGSKVILPKQATFGETNYKNTTLLIEEVEDDVDQDCDMAYVPGKKRTKPQKIAVEVKSTNCDAELKIDSNLASNELRITTQKDVNLKKQLNIYIPSTVMTKSEELLYGNRFTFHGTKEERVIVETEDIGTSTTNVLTVDVPPSKGTEKKSRNVKKRNVTTLDLPTPMTALHKGTTSKAHTLSTDKYKLKDTKGGKGSNNICHTSTPLPSMKKTGKSPGMSSKNFTCAKRKSDELMPFQIDEVETMISKMDAGPITDQDALSITSSRDMIELKVPNEAGIESILKVLENQNDKSISQIQTIKNIVNCGMQATITSRPTPKESTLEAINEKKEDKASNNFESIVAFLDEIEQHIRSDLSSEPLKTFSLDSLPRFDDLVNCSQENLAQQVISLCTRLKDKSAAISNLQDEMSKLRENTILTLKTQDDVFQSKLKEDKDESEKIIKRHQEFINELMSNKKILTDDRDRLLREMQSIEDRFTSNILALQQKHTVELKKAKDMQVAGEKLRRDRWLENKTKKITELTVKSIEPELQAMSLRQDQQLSQLREVHRHEIEDIEMKNARAMQQQVNKMRSQLNEEHLSDLTAERERHKALIEAEKLNCSEQIKRLMAAHALESTENARREKAICIENDKRIAYIRDNCKQIMLNAQTQQEHNLMALHEHAKLQNDAWKNEVIKELELTYSNREDKLRLQCMRERDCEIEEIIERFENERFANKNEMEATFETRIRSINQKHGVEIQVLKNEKAQLKSEWNMSNEKVTELEEKLESMQTNMAQLTEQLLKMEDLNAHLAVDKEQIKESLRLQMDKEFRRMEQERKDEMKAQNSDFHQTFARMQLALAHRDEMINDFVTKNRALVDKCKFLEFMGGQKHN